MSDALLKIENLKVEVEDNEILHGIDLEIRPGETHVLMGLNGAGKSTLGNTIMGHPSYHVTGGDILFKGKSILGETPDKRAKMGIFLSFQNPIEVPGVTLSGFIKNALEQKTGERVMPYAFRKKLRPMMKLLQMDESYAQRDLNVGFSGGEKKKAEILQMLMLEPDFAILDETDSGLDVDAVRIVSRGVEEFQKNSDRSLLIITHSTKILEALKVDYTHVLIDGRIVATGSASLVDEINANGFEQFLKKDEQKDDQ
ncbi:MAG: Fe-S cluster assembly ATPase SufC [Lachnospiraceae bacterium]|jgi:Fe-S cluster assembly ATP-binding protein